MALVVKLHQTKKQMYIIAFKMQVDESKKETTIKYNRNGIFQFTYNIMCILQHKCVISLIVNNTELLKQNNIEQ